MKQIMIALLLLTTLGSKADSSHDTGMVYGFDKVSLGLCRTISTGTFRFLTGHLDRTISQPHVDTMFR